MAKKQIFVRHTPACYYFSNLGVTDTKINVKELPVGRSFFLKLFKCLAPLFYDLDILRDKIDYSSQQMLAEAKIMPTQFFS